MCHDYWDIRSAKVHKWILARVCQTYEKIYISTSNIYSAWPPVFASGCQYIEKEIERFPGRIPPWRFRIMTGPGSKPCRTCENCSMLRHSPQKVMQDLIELVEEIVWEEIIWPVSMVHLLRPYCDLQGLLTD